jgi:hypothetical protein
MKFTEDRGHSNAAFAKIGGITTRELNALEAEFLALMDYRFYVEPEYFKKTAKNIQLLTKKFFVGSINDFCESLTGYN